MFSQPHLIPLGFPRVCGDVPKLMGAGAKSLLFSPRMRGCSGLVKVHFNNA